MAPTPSINTFPMTPAATGGTVTFKDGATVLGTIAISAGTATYSTSALGTGSHSITAVYSGDGSHNGSTSSPLTQTVAANLTVMLQGASITYFSTIGDAYTNANTGDTIKSQTRTYPENLQFNRAISIKLDGGYDSFFLISSGFSTIKGSLDVSRGTVDISKINFIL